jgi:hypothetical protein
LTSVSAVRGIDTLRALLFLTRLEGSRERLVAIVLVVRTAPPAVDIGRSWAAAARAPR